MSWILKKKREETAVNAPQHTFVRSYESFNFRGRVVASTLSFAASIIVCGIVYSLRCVSFEYLLI